MKIRLDQALVARGLVATRSQAESYIKLGKVKVGSAVVTKPNFQVDDSDYIKVVSEQYVSRAALKLESVANKLKLDFRDKVVLDVGSSTGGFTDFALRHGAKRVIAVDVGTNQLHPTLRNDPRIELHEQTDIRDFREHSTTKIDMILIDVSFISLREILPSIFRAVDHSAQVIAMVKPQFETGTQSKHKGVIKNDKMRRNTLKDFEIWVQKLYIIVNKADSDVSGAKGNQERFYVLKKST